MLVQRAAQRLSPSRDVSFRAWSNSSISSGHPFPLAKAAVILYRSSWVLWGHWRAAAMFPSVALTTSVRVSTPSSFHSFQGLSLVESLLGGFEVPGGFAQ